MNGFRLAASYLVSSLIVKFMQTTRTAKVLSDKPKVAYCSGRFCQMSANAVKHLRSQVLDAMKLGELIHERYHALGLAPSGHVCGKWLALGMPQRSTSKIKDDFDRGFSRAFPRAGNKGEPQMPPNGIPRFPQYCQKMTVFLRAVRYFVGSHKTNKNPLCQVAYGFQDDCGRYKTLGWCRDRNHIPACDRMNARLMPAGE
jgi:hypothetical protein